MKKALERLAVVGLTGAMVFGGSMAAFAGTWKTGAEPNQNRWWYDFENGSYAANGWQWIDGDNDGAAECYYFDADGWMLADTTTPDGHTVNADGAWTENGDVQIKAVEVKQEQAQEQPQEQEQPQAQTETTSLGKYVALSGSYQAVDVAGDFWPHDPVWINRPVAVSVTELNNTLVVTLNGSPMDVSAISGEDTSIYGYIPSLGSLVTIFGDGRMFFSSDDGSEVFYQK